MGFSFVFVFLHLDDGSIQRYCQSLFYSPSICQSICNSTFAIKQTSGPFNLRLRHPIECNHLVAFTYNILFVQKDCILWFPALIYASINQIRIDICNSRPFCDSMRLAIYCKNMIGVLVVRLYEIIDPPAISRLIISVVVDAVYRQPLFPAVSQRPIIEFFEILAPFITHLYPSCTIVTMFRYIYIIASGFDMTPTAIYRVFDGNPMRTIDI